VSADASRLELRAPAAESGRYTGEVKRRVPKSYGVVPSRSDEAGQAGAIGDAVTGELNDRGYWSDGKVSGSLRNLNEGCMVRKAGTSSRSP
jgi:hypothetical protein